MAVLSQDNLKQAAEAYKKYYAGDPLSNQELRAYIKVSKDVCLFLRELGPEFRFAWKELYMRLDDFEGFQIARKRHIGGDQT
jgi:hypothetical protein